MRAAVEHCGIHDRFGRARDDGHDRSVTHGFVDGRSRNGLDAELGGHALGKWVAPALVAAKNSNPLERAARYGRGKLRHGLLAGPNDREFTGVLNGQTARGYTGSAA